jgi:hypothetical protein
MFSAFARFPDLGCGRAASVVAAFAVSNQNQHASKAGHVVHRDRPHLVCRWRPDPTTGKPVCAWQIDGDEAAYAAQPMSGWHEGQVFALVAFPPNAWLSMRAVNPEQGAEHGRWT